MAGGDGDAASGAEVARHESHGWRGANSQIEHLAAACFARAHDEAAHHFARGASVASNDDFLHGNGCGKSGGKLDDFFGDKGIADNAANASDGDHG